MVSARSFSFSGVRLIVLRGFDSVRVYHGSAGSVLLRHGFHCQVSSMSTTCFQRACPGMMVIVS